MRALAEAVGDASPTIAREALVALGEVVATSPHDDALLECARKVLASNEHGRTNARRAARNSEDSARARGGSLLVLGLLGAAEDVSCARRRARRRDDVAERADMAIRLFGPDRRAALALPWPHASPSLLIHMRPRSPWWASLEGAPVAEVRSALRKALDDPSREVVSLQPPRGARSAGGGGAIFGKLAKLSSGTTTSVVIAAATNSV